LDMRRSEAGYASVSPLSVDDVEASRWFFEVLLTRLN
jgi:hypothetical protein